MIDEDASSMTKDRNHSTGSWKLRREYIYIYTHIPHCCSLLQLYVAQNDHPWPSLSCASLV